jgi:hypothetical protein
VALPGGGKNAAFDAGFGKRRPDVIGLQSGKPDLVHFAEGKLLKHNPDKFVEVTNQLDTWRSWVDYLWAVFHKEEWQSASEHHSEWKNHLMKRRFGLLLVDKIGGLDLVIPAQRNQLVDQHKRATVILKLRGDEHAILPMPLLGKELASQVAEAIATALDAMLTAAKPVFAPKASENRVAFDE